MLRRTRVFRPLFLRYSRLKRPVIAARDDARHSERNVAADTVLDKLATRLAAAKASRSTRSE